MVISLSHYTDLGSLFYPRNTPVFRLSCGDSAVAGGNRGPVPINLSSLIPHTVIMHATHISLYNALNLDDYSLIPGNGMQHATPIITMHAPAPNYNSAIRGMNNSPKCTYCE